MSKDPTWERQTAVTSFKRLPEGSRSSQASGSGEDVNGNRSGNWTGNRRKNLLKEPSGIMCERKSVQIHGNRPLSRSKSLPVETFSRDSGEEDIGNQSGNSFTEHSHGSHTLFVTNFDTDRRHSSRDHYRDLESRGGSSIGDYNSHGLHGDQNNGTVGLGVDNIYGTDSERGSNSSRGSHDFGPSGTGTFRGLKHESWSGESASDWEASMSHSHQGSREGSRSRRSSA